MTNLFHTTIQPHFEEHRSAFLARARTIALRLGRAGSPITINDVRQHVQPPEDIDGRVMGAVFRTPDWQCIGYIGSTRRVSHGRPVAQFVLRQGVGG